MIPHESKDKEYIELASMHHNSGIAKHVRPAKLAHTGIQVRRIPGYALSGLTQPVLNQ